MLKNSRPVLDSGNEIEREVIRKISKMNHRRISPEEIFDFLFGWIYIGWVRRSLIALSGCLVGVFVFQQIIILKQLNFISSQTTVNIREIKNNPADIIERKLLLYKFPGSRLRTQSVTISEKQMNQLLDSVNKLQVRYKDLINLINEDPELKKLIEKKIIESEHLKPNL